MDKLRTPFFIVAAALIVLVVLLESGSGLVIKPPHRDLGSLGLERIAADHDAKIDSAEMQRLSEKSPPPGMAIGKLALLDGLVLFTVALIGGRYLLTDQLSGRLQGVVSLIVSLLVILAGVLFLFKALAEVLLMISLFLSAPFGTIAYLAIWGFFNRGGAQLILSISLALKLGFVASLALAQQQFLQNKGLVLIILTSLAGNLIINFLHALVPVFLVSITDGIAAIVVLILTLLWAIATLIGAIVAVVKAIA